MKFKKGNRVKLRSGGQYEHQRVNGSKDTTGTIIDAYNDSHYVIRFDNGYKNSYAESDFISVAPNWKRRLE